MLKGGHSMMKGSPEVSLTKWVPSTEACMAVCTAVFMEASSMVGISDITL